MNFKTNFVPVLNDLGSEFLSRIDALWFCSWIIADGFLRALVKLSAVILKIFAEAMGSAANGNIGKVLIAVPWGILVALPVAFLSIIAPIVNPRGVFSVLFRQLDLRDLESIPLSRRMGYGSSSWFMRLEVFFRELSDGQDPELAIQAEQYELEAISYVDIDFEVAEFGENLMSVSSFCTKEELSKALAAQTAAAQEMTSQKA